MKNLFQLLKIHSILYIVKLDKELSSVIFDTASYFRKEGFAVDFDYLDRSVKAQMREANKSNAKFVLFIGGDEYKSGLCNLKKMSTGDQLQVPVVQMDQILQALNSPNLLQNDRSLY